MFKKTIYILILGFLATSCGNTFDSVKRGVTGQKSTTADEFLVQKKDPLILPPNYENLPTPDERKEAEESSSFEKKLESKIEEDASPSSSDSAEESILKKIQSE